MGGELLRKLRINRETLRSLDDSAMRGAAGALTGYYQTINSPCVSAGGRVCLALTNKCNSVLPSCGCTGYYLTINGTCAN